MGLEFLGLALAVADVAAQGGTLDPPAVVEPGADPQADGGLVVVGVVEAVPGDAALDLGPMEVALVVRCRQGSGGQGQGQEGEGKAHGRSCEGTTGVPGGKDGPPDEARALGFGRLGSERGAPCVARPKGNYRNLVMKS